MNKSTKNQLIASIIVAIIAVLAVWYITLPRQQYNKLATLVGITFLPPPPPSSCSPACAAGNVCVNGTCAPPDPILTFTFSQPITPADVEGTTASLKDFKLSSGVGPKVAPVATAIIEALLLDGGVPFTPVISSPTTITSNTISTALQDQLTRMGLVAQLSFAGTGEMWFAIPMRQAQ